MSKEKTNNSNDKKNVEKKETTAKKTSTKTAKKTSAKADEKVTKTKSKDTNKEIKKDKKIVEEKIVDEKIIDTDIDEEYDEDLEDFINDEDDEKEEVIKDKTPSKKKEVKKEDKPEPKKIKEAKKEKEDKNKEDKVSKENIKKIEKLAKEKSKKNKKKANNSSKIKDFGYFLEKNRNVISSFIGGVLLTVLIVIIIWPSRIATLKNGTQPVVKIANKTYTADDLYTQMKNHYSVSQLLDQIDNDILTKMYPEDKKMTEEVESNAEYYINMYKQYYNYTEEEFLSANGFASRDAYLEYLKLDNRRKKYQNEYVKKNLTDDEIKKYYDENVYGDINCQHILVETKSDNSNSNNSNSSSKNSDSKNKLSDSDAKKLAQEIIDKINDGKSWKDIKKEYKDKVTFENLGYQSWDSDLEDSFKKALKKMDNNSYSKEPVKTSYGYHVIYRIDQKEAPSLKKTKSKIIEKLVSKKESEDSKLLYKALISLRNEKNIKFQDTDMKEKYEKYIKQYK